MHTSAGKEQFSIKQELLLPQLLKIYWIKDMCLTSSGFIEKKLDSMAEALLKTNEEGKNKSQAASYGEKR